jgi:ABC-type lipoprotein release transport system permease subunit
MSPLFRLSLRGATRKPMRTVLTAGIIVAATALLVIALSWLEGIFGDMMGTAADSAGHVRVVNPEFAERERLMPLCANVPDVAPVLDALGRQPGVQGVYARIMSGATLSAGDEIGEVFGMVTGATREWFVDRAGYADKLVEGRWFTAGTDEIVLGARLVEQSGAKLGQDVVLLGMTQDGSMSPIRGPVVGIAQSGSGLVDQGVFVDLPRMQWMTDIPGGAIEVLAYIDDYEQASSFATAIARDPAFADYAVQAWDQREPYAQMLPMVSGIWAFLIFVIVSVAALGVWNTMMMSVLERTDEIGVLRAMGLTRPAAVAMFVGEGVVIALIGGVVGVCLGLIPAYYLATHGIELSEQLTQNIGAQLPIQTTMKAKISGPTLIGSFGLALVMALLGSLLPALRAALITPVSAMRSGR